MSYFFEISKYRSDKNQEIDFYLKREPATKCWDCKLVLIAGERFYFSRHDDKEYDCLKRLFPKKMMAFKYSLPSTQKEIEAHRSIEGKFSIDSYHEDKVYSAKMCPSCRCEYITKVSSMEPLKCILIYMRDEKKKKTTTKGSENSKKTKQKTKKCRKK